MPSLRSRVRVRHVQIAGLAAVALTLVYLYSGLLMLVRPSVISCLVTPTSRCVASIAADATFPSRIYSSFHSALDHLTWTDEVELVREVHDRQPRSSLRSEYSFPLSARTAFDQARLASSPRPCPTEPGECLGAASHVVTRGVWAIEDPVAVPFRPQLDAEETRTLSRLLTASLSSIEQRQPRRSPADQLQRDSFHYKWLGLILDALHPKTRAALPHALVNRAVAAADAARAAQSARIQGVSTPDAQWARLDVLIQSEAWTMALEPARELLAQVDFSRVRHATYLYCCGQSHLSLVTVFVRNTDAETAWKIARTIEFHGDQIAALSTFKTFQSFDWHLNAVLAYQLLQDEPGALRLLRRIVDTLPDDDGGRATCGFYGCDDFSSTRRHLLEATAEVTCRLQSAELSAKVTALARTREERIAVFHGADRCSAELNPARTPLEIAKSVGAPPTFEIFVAGIRRAVERGDRDRARTIVREAIEHGQASGDRPGHHLRWILRLAVMLDDRTSIPILTRKLILASAPGSKYWMGVYLADAAVVLAAAERNADRPE